MFQYSVFTRFFIKQIGDDKCSKILFSKNKNFLSGIVVSFLRQSPLFVYRYDRMTVSIRIGCPLYRYCIDTDCIVPALSCMTIHCNTAINCDWFKAKAVFIKQNVFLHLNMFLNFFLNPWKPYVLTKERVKTPMYM